MRFFRSRTGIVTIALLLLSLLQPVWSQDSVPFKEKMSAIRHRLADTYEPAVLADMDVSKALDALTEKEKSTFAGRISDFQC